MFGFIPCQTAPVCPCSGCAELLVTADPQQPQPWLTAKVGGESCFLLFSVMLRPHIRPGLAPRLLTVSS